MHYDSTYLTIQRLGNRFSEYEQNYNNYLSEYVAHTDGSEIHFIENEIAIFEDLIFLWNAESTENGIKGNYQALEIKENYKRYRNELQDIYMSCYNRLDNSTERKIDFLTKRLSELGIQRGTAFFDLIVDEQGNQPKETSLNTIMLFLCYLDKHGHINLNKIHPDHKHLAIILSFLTSKSQNTISQKLSKFNSGSIHELKDNKSTLKALNEFLEPYGDTFPKILEELKNDIKKLKN